MPGCGPLIEGSLVDYHSSSLKCWVPAIVTHIDPESGAVRLDRRPDKDFSKSEQQRNFRPRTRPTPQRLAWVRRVLREGRIEEEARELFERHAFIPMNEDQTEVDGLASVPVQVLRVGGLGAAAEDLDALLGVSGSICNLKDQFQYQPGAAFTLSSFTSVFRELLWEVHRDHGQALSHQTVPRRKEAPRAFYDREKELGKGTFGEVWLGRCRRTKARRAIKSIKKEQGPDIHEEVERLTQLDHPNIVKLYEFYEDACNIYLVMDYCSAGELQSRISKQKQTGGFFQEFFVAHVMGQIMKAIAHVHRHGILHLDIKSANIMLMPSRRTLAPSKNIDSGMTMGQPPALPHVMVIDLGVAQIFRPGAFSINEPTGTPLTMAPEVWNGELTPKADIWSCGIVHYQIMSLGFPYHVPCDVRAAKSFWAPKPQPTWDSVLLKTFSPGAIRLCKRMLVHERHHRPSATDALSSNFLNQGIGGAEAMQYFPQEYMQQMQKTPERTLLQKRVSLAIAKAWPNNQLPSIKRFFSELDVSFSGRLERSSIAKALEESGLSTERAAEVADAMDFSRDGYVDWTEFVACCIDPGSAKLEDDLKRVFNEANQKKDGLLTVQDIGKLFKATDSNKISEAALDAMSDLVGRNDETARVDWPTFAAHFRPRSTLTTESFVKAASAHGGTDGSVPSSGSSTSGGIALPSGGSSMGYPTDSSSSSAKSNAFSPGGLDMMAAQLIGWAADIREAILGPPSSTEVPNLEAPLRDLENMGFSDKEKCLAALKRRGRHQVTASVIDEITSEPLLVSNVSNAALKVASDEHMRQIVARLLQPTPEEESHRQGFVPPVR